MLIVNRHSLSLSVTGVFMLNRVCVNQSKCVRGKKLPAHSRKSKCMSGAMTIILFKKKKKTQNHKHLLLIHLESFFFLMIDTLHRKEIYYILFSVLVHAVIYVFRIITSIY